MDFRVMPRRYGPTVHLTPTGELDLDTRTALDEVPAALDGASVVACDMRHLTFMDVTGLYGLTTFVRRLDARGIAFFAYNWQPQPLRLMDLVDGFHQPAGRKGTGGPTRLLRRSLQGSVAAAREAVAARARHDVLPRVPASSRTR
ncbi:STAS domain-containing protein [Streptomyces sp. NPDC090054]|uniref:STAS domain-containing protein n=1 Tax=Streptomyces sp. NPDC090054 TaxID=3365933 RepID=UPI00382C7FF8